MKVFESFPRVKLANYPTPLDEAPRLAKEIGLEKLFIKRDDLINFAGGGTKVRKIEYDLPEILENKHNVVLTAGGAQSNHARILAAAAKRFNIETKLVLGGREFNSFDGNLLLDILFDAEIRYLTNDDENDHLTAAMNKWAEELKQDGMKPYISPIGGCTALGSLGCINAVKEIKEQLNQDEKIQIALPVGSCGTLAGMILGAKLLMPDSRVIGISISRTSTAIKKRVREIVCECCDLLEINFDFDESEVEVYDQYFEEYGVPTKAGQDAIFKCARTEGLLLDPVYTGKAMSGLIDLAKSDRLDKNLPTVFLHTGGMPILFSYKKEFRNFAKFRTI